MLTEVVNVPVHAEKFFSHLRSSRLLPEDEVQVLERRADEEPLVSLQDELIRENRLTEYQLTRIRSGQSGRLVLGKYRVLRELGHGGFGSVFLAYHTVMHRQVALKMLGAQAGTDEVTRALFRREVVAATQLSHPHIAVAFDADECDGETYFVMEYIDGPTLETHVAKNGPMCAAFGATILAQTASALGYADALGFVHRDIKPANLMLSGQLPDPDIGSDGGQHCCVKLLDFGLARIPTAPLTKSILGTLPCPDGTTFGTPAYMSPEQIYDPHSVDVRSDLYSLGCTMFFALTGRLPFAGRTPAEMYRKQLSEPPVSVQLLNPAIPSRLADIVRVLMAKEPGDRFQSPGELLAVLAATPQAVVLPPPMAAPEPLRPAVIAPVPSPPPAGDLDPPVGSLVPPDEALRLWSEWMTVLDSVVTGEELAVSDAEYQLLYAGLLKASSTIERSLSSEARLPWQRLATAVEPWVNLRALSQLDRRMLASVRKSCASINAQLVPVPARRHGSGLWLSLGVAALIGLAILVVLLLR